MNRIILAISLASIMMGCSTALRTGQTIDDVYFSPARPGAEYVNIDQKDEYRASEVPMTDRYMRMKAFGGARWNAFDDDYAYWNNPHWNNSSYFNVYPSYGYSGMNSLYFGRPMSYGISNYLNPFSPNYYGQPVIVYNSGKSTAPTSSGPRTYSLSNYTPMKSSSADSKMGAGFFAPADSPIIPMPISHEVDTIPTAVASLMEAPQELFPIVQTQAIPVQAVPVPVLAAALPAVDLPL